MYMRLNVENDIMQIETKEKEDDKMILKRIKINIPAVGDTNCYIVQDEKTKETMVIDPGGDVDKILEMLNTINAKLKYIVLTHCHGDHIAGVNKLKQKAGGRVLIHILDEPRIKRPTNKSSRICWIGNCNSRSRF